MRDEQPFNVGEVVYLTSGAYSDYGVHGVYVVRKQFRVQDFMKSSSPSSPEYNEVNYTLLEIDGYIEPIPSRELWAG